MAKQNDSLITIDGPDRVHYETGVLLNADDFIAEQNYHRSRLARALRYANGSGTLAGLKVEYEAAVAASEDSEGRAERILINPGLAIDRLGRLIEVPHALCLRINNWYQQQKHVDLQQSWNPVDAGMGFPAGVMVDVFIRFAACERGKTPAFRSGPFDSIDTVTAARLRDGYETELVLRKEDSPKTPKIPWSDLESLPQAERAEQLREEIFSAWKEATLDNDLKGLVPLDEHAAGQDTTSLFLARMTIPADESIAGNKPERKNDVAITIRNDLRAFVISANALAAMLGIKVNESAS